MIAIELWSEIPDKLSSEARHIQDSMVIIVRSIRDDFALKFVQVFPSKRIFPISKNGNETKRYADYNEHKRKEIDRDRNEVLYQNVLIGDAHLEAISISDGPVIDVKA